MSQRLLPNWLLFSILGISLAGFLDAAYLVASYYLGFDPGCSIFNGCDVVLNSPYSKIYGVPISLPGAIYYLVIFLSSVLVWESGSLKALPILKWLPSLGLIASGVLVYIQAFMLYSFCTYCVFSAITSTALFVLSLYIRKYVKISL